MGIAVGAELGGTPLNEVAIAELRRAGHDVGVGTHDPSQSDEYPDYAATVAGEVITGRCERGLLISGSAVGVAVDTALVASTTWPSRLEATCYVSGPTSFVQRASALLPDAGNSHDRIRTERFAPTGDRR